MSNSKEFELPKSKTIHEAILEIAFDTQPILPNLADFSALYNGFVNCFTFCKFEFFRHSYSKYSSQNLLDFFLL